MQDPKNNLEDIIKCATDLYCIIYSDSPKETPEEIIKMGKKIKRQAEGLVDMAWYKVDADDWDNKHLDRASTEL